MDESSGQRGQIYDLESTREYDEILQPIIYWKIQYKLIFFIHFLYYYYLSPIGVLYFRIEVLYFRLALSYSSYGIYMG